MSRHQTGALLVAPGHPVDHELGPSDLNDARHGTIIGALNEHSVHGQPPRLRRRPVAPSRIGNIGRKTYFFGSFTYRRRPDASPVLSGEHARACNSNPSMGRARWMLDILAGEMVKLTAHEGL
jgi:hypothetical protein